MPFTIITFYLMLSEIRLSLFLSRLAEALERDELFSVAVPTSPTPISSDFLTRNRYLSRIGASVRTIL